MTVLISDRPTEFTASGSHDVVAQRRVRQRVDRRYVGRKRNWHDLTPSSRPSKPRTNKPRQAARDAMINDGYTAFFISVIPPQFVLGSTLGALVPPREIMTCRLSGSDQILRIARTKRIAPRK